MGRGKTTRRRAESPNGVESPYREQQRRWNWVGFFCAFLLIGTVTFLNVTGPLSDRLGPHLVEVFVVASVSGVLAGRYGDQFWWWFGRVVRWPYRL